jgi:hypothetical protein
MAYQEVTFAAGDILDEFKLNQLQENQREISKKQYALYNGNGSVVSNHFSFPNLERSEGSGLIVRNTSGGDALHAVVDCWVNWRFTPLGSGTHGYSGITQFFAAGGTENLGQDQTHEGSTTGYTMSGSTFMRAGDKIRFTKDYWPQPVSSVRVSFTASKHIE